MVPKLEVRGRSGDHQRPRPSGSRNTNAQIVALAATYVGSFLIAPVMLSQLGLTALGTWAVTGALAQYAGILDLGITRALSRFVALFDGERNDLVGEVMGFGFLAAALLSSVILLLAFVAAPPVRHLFHLHLEMDQLRVILVASAAMFAATTVGRVIAAFPNGRQDFVSPSYGAIAASAINLPASIAVLFVSHSLVAYAVVSAGAAALSPVCVWAFVRKANGPIPVKRPSRQLIRRVAGYGVTSQVPWVLDLANYQTDKVVLGILIDVRTAAVYELVNRVSGALRQLSIVATGVIMPRAVALVRRHGKAGVVDAAAAYTRVITLFSALLFAAGTVSGYGLLVLWLGRMPHDGMVIFIGLNVAYLLNSASGALSSVLLADGAQRLLVIPAVLTTGLNVALTVALGPLLGTIGVLIGTCIALAVGSIATMFLFARDYRTSFARLLGSVGRDIAACALCAVISFGLLIELPKPTSRLSGLVFATGLLIPFVALVALLLRPHLLRALSLARKYGRIDAVGAGGPA